MAIKIPDLLNVKPVTDAPFWDKIKSKKFLFVMLWTLFVVWGFIVMFWTRQEVSWFSKLLEYGFWINSLFIVVQGVQDLPKADDNLSLTSRKAIVAFMQIVFLATGFGLSFYLQKKTGGGDLTFLNTLITNAGAAITALIGVGWTIQNGKLVQGTPTADQSAAPAASKEK